MSPTKDSTQATTARGDALEKAEAKKEGLQPAATEGFKGEKALDKAIGDAGGAGGEDPEITSAVEDPLEEAEAKKEAK